MPARVETCRTAPAKANENSAVHRGSVLVSGVTTPTRPARSAYVYAVNPTTQVTQADAAISSRLAASMPKP